MYQQTYTEPSIEVKNVFTWLQTWEWETECVYDTEFGWFVPIDTIDAYTQSFDYTEIEALEYANKLKKLI